MLINQSKGKQNQFHNLRSLVEDEAEEELIGEGLSRDNDREVDRDPSNDQAIIAIRYLAIPGFLEDQINSLIYCFNGILGSVFERYFLILANQLSQDLPQSATPALQPASPIPPDDLEEELEPDTASARS